MRYKGFKTIDQVLPMSEFESVGEIIAKKYYQMVAKDIVEVFKKYFPDTKIDEKKVLGFARMLVDTESEGKT